MGLNLQKLWTAAIGALIATQLTADETVTTESSAKQPALTPPIAEVTLSPPSSLNSRSTTPETRTAESAANAAMSTSGQSSTASGVIDGNLAIGVVYAGPQLHQDAIGITVGADYILWQVIQEGLETVASNYYATGNTLPVTGSTGEPKFHPLSGFKVHGTLTLLHREDLDFFFQYSWLQRLNRSNEGTGSNTTIPLFIAAGADAYAASSKSLISWNSVYRISYNVLDFETGRLSSLVKDTFAFRPFVGIRGVWNQSSWNPSYVGILNYRTPDRNTNNFLSSIQNTGGAGIRAGLDYAISYFSEFQYLAPLKLVGTLALSGVYGRTCINTITFNESYDSGTSGSTFLDNQRVVYRVLPIIDLSMGFSWNRNLSRGNLTDLYNLELHALWEIQSWLSYGKQFVIYPNVGSSANLTVQGLTLGATFSF